MKKNKVLLVINGESFRVGPQFSRGRNTDSTQMYKIENYKNIDYYKQLYSNIIGKDTIQENLDKIDIENSIEYNLNNILN
jgi:hypothetical protein